MTKIGQTIASGDGGGVEPTTIVLNLEMKAPAMRGGRDHHTGGVRVAGDVMRGFAKKEEDLPVKFQRGGVRIAASRSIQMPVDAFEQGGGALTHGLEEAREFGRITLAHEPDDAAHGFGGFASETVDFFE